MDGQILCDQCGGGDVIVERPGGVLMARARTGDACGRCGAVWSSEVEIDGLAMKMSYSWRLSADKVLRRICDDREVSDRQGLGDRES